MLASRLWACFFGCCSIVTRLHLLICVKEVNGKKEAVEIGLNRKL